jgi:hypothetical protein
MKIRHISLSSATVLLLLQIASGQGFVNMNFEQAIIVTDPSVPYYPYGVYASDALPGWTAVGFLSPNYITYNALSLGATSVTLCGTNSTYSPSALDGRFSIDLYGGTSAEPSAASIGQTALVPAGAASIQFIAQGVAQPLGGPLLVSLGGQNISYSAISSGPDYTLYGGNVPSGLVGQVEQLIFSTPPDGGNNYWELDDIQFSSSSVPEPSTLSLFGICILIFYLRKWFSFKFVVRQSG